MKRVVQQFMRGDLRSFFHLRAVKGRLRAGLVLWTALVLGLPALGQLDTGSISGTVTDPSGSMVGNAQITATEPGRSSAVSQPAATQAPSSPSATLTTDSAAASARSDLAGARPGAIEGSSRDA